MLDDAAGAFGGFFGLDGVMKNWELYEAGCPATAGERVFLRFPNGRLLESHELPGSCEANHGVAMPSLEPTASFDGVASARRAMLSVTASYLAAGLPGPGLEMVWEGDLA